MTSEETPCACIRIQIRCGGLGVFERTAMIEKSSPLEISTCEDEDGEESELNNEEWLCTFCNFRNLGGSFCLAKSCRRDRSVVGCELSSSRRRAAPERFDVVAKSPFKSPVKSLPAAKRARTTKAELPTGAASVKAQHHSALSQLPTNYIRVNVAVPPPPLCSSDDACALAPKLAFKKARMLAATQCLTQLQRQASRATLLRSTSPKRVRAPTPGHNLS